MQLKKKVDSISFSLIVFELHIRHSVLKLITDIISYVSVNYYTFVTAIAATAIFFAAMLAPPLLHSFPPQGAPQPGDINAGGGFTPEAALTVIILNNRYYLW